MEIRFEDEKLPQIKDIIQMVVDQPQVCSGYVDDDKRTLLHIACQMQSLELVKIVLPLFENKSPIDSLKWTPLHISVASAPTSQQLDETYRIVQFLLENGVDITMSNKKKMNVYHFACSRGRVDLVELFLEKWKEGASSRDTYNNTPLHKAAASTNVQCATLIAKKTHTILAQNSLKKTPLHIACEEQHLEMIKTLIDLGGDADMKDDDDKFPFEYIENRLQFKEICQYYKQRNNH
ncbi:26S proteasome non-ATPase regulatory subunit [Entamoeba marina]